MKNLMLLYSTLLLSVASAQVIAAETPFNVAMSPLSHQCHAETLKVLEDASLVPCQRALLKGEFQSMEERSVNYFNLAVIQQSKGELKGAMESLRRSVSLTRRVDKRYAALAILAHKLGDVETAKTSYEAIADAIQPDISPDVLANMTRGHERLISELETSELLEQRLADHRGR